MKVYQVAAAALLFSGIAAAQTPVNLFGDATPNNPAILDDTQGATMGVRFYSIQTGTINGIRFYRAALNPAGYLVQLFDGTTGTRLASAQSADDVCQVPCWEEIEFAAPISIAANKTYVAAYYTSNGSYADDEYTTGGLTNGQVSGPLIAPASAAVGGNGVYTYSTGYPQLTWHDSNYYVDVSFIPAAGSTPTLSLAFNPQSPSLTSDAPLASQIAAVAVTVSDGSIFSGTLGFGSPYGDGNGTCAISGSNVVLARSLAGDALLPETINCTITATQ